MVANFAGTTLAFMLSGIRQLAMPARPMMFWLGVATIIGGSLLRRHCFRMLGQYFTGNVQVLQGQPVIELGAYRLVRHPSYTAGILMFAGIGLALGNWGSLIAQVVITLAGYAYRVYVEERALVAKLGDPYRVYMLRTRRFIPYII